MVEKLFRAREGLTLIETMLAMVIFVIGIMGIMGMHGVTVVNNERARHFTAARGLAMSKIDELKRYPKTDWQLVGQIFAKLTSREIGYLFS